jgi:hypothetical protein
MVDERLLSPLFTQLEHRHATLTRGARHVGWTLGLGDRESIGPGDRVITGSIVQIPVERSGQILADFGGLATVELTVDHSNQ